MFRRSPAFTIAVLVGAALSLSACGSDSLSTSSTTSPAAGASSASGSGSASAGGGVDSALAAKLPESIKSAGVIKIGTDATYQPNEYLDADGKTVIGMDVDLFNAVAAKFGVKTEWVPSAFDAIILGVSSKKYDMGISSFTINAERLKKATMVSYFSAGTQWVTQKGNPKSVDPENACGLKIAAQKGTVQVDDLDTRSKKCTDAGEKPIEQLVDADQGKVTTMVVSGKADAMLADLPPAIAAVETTGSLELLGEQYDSAPYGYVLPKDGSDDFAGAIVEALKQLQADGTYEEILTKWKTEGGAITDFAVNPDVG
ncbi:MAG: ABC transporter substrate-binding protein [Tetrasphaera sp.]